MAEKKSRGGGWFVCCEDEEKRNEKDEGLKKSNKQRLRKTKIVAIGIANCCLVVIETDSEVKKNQEKGEDHCSFYYPKNPKEKKKRVELTGLWDK